MTEKSTEVKTLFSSRSLPRWHTYQGQSNDCGPYCVAIVGDALRGPVVTAQAQAATSVAGEKPAPPPLPKAKGIALPSRIPNWATFPWGVARGLRARGLDVRWRVGATEERLRENLRNDVTTIVIVGDLFHRVGKRWHPWSHYKVLYGWDMERGWAFVDPAVQSADGVAWQAAEPFTRQWRGLGRQLIEVRP